MAQPFFKYQGTGNDFVIVACEPLPDVVPLICDRRRGVGADGVLFVTEIDESTQSARMTVINRDGSRPEMCGNGVRCVARYLVEHRGFERRLTVISDAGPRACDVELDGDDVSVTVEMGQAIVGREAKMIEVALDDKSERLIPVNVGNPHAVVFTSSIDRDWVERLGRHLNATKDAFPDGVNLEFVKADKPNRPEVLVFERGVGFTHACGTGACAVAAAGVAHGVFEPKAVHVRLPGGGLTITQDEVSHSDTESFFDIRMKGDVEAAFYGTFSEKISRRFAKEAS